MDGKDTKARHPGFGMAGVWADVWPTPPGCAEARAVDSGILPLERDPAVRREAADHHVPVPRGGARERAGLVAGAREGPAVEGARGRRGVEADVEVRVAGRARDREHHLGL